MAIHYRPRLILFRHGIAESGEAAGKRDADRRLTPKGQRRTQAAARGLATLVDGSVEVVHSPLVRARETADIVASVMADAETRELDILAPGTELATMAAGLSEFGGRRLAVGHEPGLSQLAGFMVGACHGSAFEMKKAAACGLEPGNGSLGSGACHWLLPPRVLRQLAAS